MNNHIINFFYFFSESALLVLHPDWEKIPKRIKVELSSIFKKMLDSLHFFKVHLESIKSCHFMLSIIQNPWDHHYLPNLLYGDPCEEEGMI